MLPGEIYDCSFPRPTPFVASRVSETPSTENGSHHRSDFNRYSAPIPHLETFSEEPGWGQFSEAEKKTRKQILLLNPPTQRYYNFIHSLFRKPEGSTEWDDGRKQTSPVLMRQGAWKKAAIGAGRSVDRSFFFSFPGCCCCVSAGVLFN